jgi:hypothetical protein
MVKAIEFAVRDSAGGLVHGAVAGDGGSNFVQLGTGDEISLHLARQSIAGYAQQGDDLIITLVDGRQIVLDGYFNTTGEPNQLYLSQNGEVIAVDLTTGSDGVVYADYGTADGWDKFSTLDDLRFAETDDLALMQGAADEPAGMAAFVPGLLGLGGAGAAIAGAGIIGGIVAGGGGGGGGDDDDDDDGPAEPTVDEPDSSHTVTTETAEQTLDVSGTGEPGDQVTVIIGDQTQETVIGEDGTWHVTFPEDGLPPDGTYETEVVFEHGDGTTETLDGPTFILDLTPPEVEITSGAQSTGDVENAAEYQDGVTITGEGEAGASVTVEVNGHTQSTVIGQDGTWSVTFPTSQVPPGEYEIPMVVTATDPLGNDTVIHDVLVVDTVPHPIGFEAVTADNTVNGAENAAGFTIGGTSTAGAVLTVTIGGASQTVTVGANGAWSVSYPAGSLTAGEYDATVTATTTDAAGNATTETHTFRVDTTTSVSFTVPVAGDDVVNASEAAAGVTMTGLAQPGATVQVAWNGTTLPATVAADGSWSVTFPTTAGGTYASTATVTATDAAGNTATATHAVNVDTETDVSFNAGQAGGDNVVSDAERTGGLVLTGTAEPGATVAVTFQGVTRTVTADGAGNWQASYAAGEYPAGTYNATATVTATDAAGNTATDQHSVRVDTEVTPFNRLTLSTGADQVLNAAEAANGLTVTGVVEPGSTVTVQLANGSTVQATVAANGSWTAMIPAGQIPAGENNVPLTIRATDAVGNTATLNETVQVDTVVRDFARTGGPIGGDGTLNAAETASGVSFAGTVEPGSTLVVQLSNGEQITTTAGANGTWSVTFAPDQLPTGEGTATATFTATDPAGNVNSFTDGFAYDTVMPGTPEVISFSRTSAGLRGIGTALTDDTYSFTAIDDAGHTTSIGASRQDDTFYGETEFRLNQTVPDGSYLVIDTRDEAGNETSTLLIVDNRTSVDVDLGRDGLSQFDFSAIDLTFAPEANLTLTASDLAALTGTERELIVKGDSDDHVSLDDATATGQVREVDGHSYNVYTLGDGTVLVDEDIQTTVI